MLFRGIPCSATICFKARITCCCWCSVRVYEKRSTCCSSLLPAFTLRLGNGTDLCQGLPTDVVELHVVSGFLIAGMAGAPGKWDSFWPVFWSLGWSGSSKPSLWLSAWFSQSLGGHSVGLQVLCWGSRFGPTDLGPMIVLPAWVAFWLLSRAFSRRCVPPQFLHVFVLMAWTLVGLFMSLSWIWDAVASYVLPSLGASSREKPGPLRAGSSACRDLCSWRWSAPASARLILLERRRISTPAACAGWQSRPAIGVSGHQLQSSNPEIVCRLKLFFEPAEDCRWCLLLFR